VGPSSATTSARTPRSRTPPRSCHSVAVPTNEHDGIDTTASCRHIATSMQERRGEERQRDYTPNAAAARTGRRTAMQSRASASSPATAQRAVNVAAAAPARC
jgi:hypothetical protein